MNNKVEIKSFEDLLDVFENTDGYYLGDFTCFQIADYLKNMKQQTEEKDKEIERLNKELKEKKEIINKFIADENGGVSYKLQNENERLNNIINELKKDLKTLWNVCWNNDTEMTSYQNEIFDKYYDKFHKKN